tara:strand:+ start:1251 stop:1955 length:705 start_codon:yes stop_codon:yes gene_type:complete
MRRLETAEPLGVMLHKPRASTFSPHCIVIALFPGRYPSRIQVGRGYHAVQINTLKWLVSALVRFVKQPGASKVGIVNTDNQFVLAQEIKDSVHVTLRAIDTIRLAIHAPSPGCSFIQDVLVPVLSSASLQEGEGEMTAFLQELERNSAFLQETRRHVLTLTTKASAVAYIAEFERSSLGLNARSAVTRTLTRTRISYGGSPVIAGFSLAMMLQAWCELKIDLYTVISLPTHRWR